MRGLISARLAACSGELSRALSIEFTPSPARARSIGMRSRHQIIDVLGDIRAVVANPLDVLGYEQQMRARRDAARILHHVGEQFPEQALIEIIELFVSFPYRQRFLGILSVVGVEHVL